jgi:hypothetical protein
MLLIIIWSSYLALQFDDTNLLVPERTDAQLHEEFEAIFKWAAINKMTINMAKTKEIVFCRPNPKLYVTLPSLPGIEQISEAKLLGVICSLITFISTLILTSLLRSATKDRI